MSRPSRAAAVVLLFMVTVGCSGPDADTAALDMTPPTSTTTATQDPAVTAECVAVERAYNAWHWEPMTSADWSAFQVERRMEDGKTFLDDVTGYDDKAARSLAVAVADYNLQLSLVNMDYLIEGSADTTAARAAHTTVIDAFEDFQDQTCG